MVPDKFNMVDMGDIDLIEIQGLAVEGLYQKLVESIALCRYQCLYNWKFNGILIPPSYVEMELRDGEVWINEGVSVDEEDVVHIYSIEPEPPTPVEPVIQPLVATSNGIYNTPSGIDGYDPVTVNVASPQPIISPITITENGTVEAPAGIDGYSPIIVNVPSGGSQTYTGNSVPDSSLGSNGDWYIMTMLACEINSLFFDTGVNGNEVYGFNFRFRPIASLNDYQTYLASVLDNFTIGQKGSFGTIYGRIRSDERITTTSVSELEIKAIGGVIECSNGYTSTYNGNLSLSSASGNIRIGGALSNRYSDFAFLSLTLYDVNGAVIDDFYYDPQSNTIIGSNGALTPVGPGSISSYPALNTQKAFHKENGIWVKY